MISKKGPTATYLPEPLRDSHETQTRPSFEEAAGKSCVISQTMLVISGAARWIPLDEAVRMMHYPRGIQLQVLNGTARRSPNQVEARLVGPVQSVFRWALFGSALQDSKTRHCWKQQGVGLVLNSKGSEVHVRFKDVQRRSKTP